MTYRNLFFNLLLALSCCFYSPAITAGMMPNMEDFEKELAEANKAIEEYVASLPPAEQAEFNRQVEEVSQMFENMSEEEFEKFLGEMFADEPMMMEQNPFDIAPAAAAEEVPAVVLSAEDKKKAETALAVLRDITTQSNLFMVIVNSSSDLPNTISRWGKRGVISNWQDGADWDSFKKELELFIQKLYRAEEQDLTTKKYKYLLELIADEALYNNLIQLQTGLKTLLPIINIPEFSIQKLSPESKTAIKNILGKYTESFYLLGIPKALDTLFEKYAPEEEKIRTAEEAATKRAQEIARGVRSPATATEAGTEAEMMGYGDYYGGYGYDYGYPDYGYSDYGYSSPYDYGYSPDYGSFGSDYSSGGAGKGSGGGSKGGGSAGGKAEKAEKEEAEEDKDKKGKKSKKDQFIPNYEIERSIANIKSNLEDFKAAMVDEDDKPTNLAEIDKTITKDEPIDPGLAGIILPTIVDKKISAIDEAIKKITSKAKSLDADDLAHYQSEVTRVFDANKKELESFRKALGKFESKTEEEKRQAREYAQRHPNAPQSTDKIDIDTLTPAQRWAYFDAKDDILTTQEDLKLKETIHSRVSLLEVKKNIDKIFDDLKDFTAKKANAPAPKKQPAASAKAQK